MPEKTGDQVIVAKKIDINNEIAEKSLRPGDAFDLDDQPSDLARPDRLDLPSIGSIWALRARFVARLSRFAARICSSGAAVYALARPGPRFSRPKRLFFRSFCVPRTFDAQNVQHRKNIVKTNTKRTSVCIEPKSIKNCSAWVPTSTQQREHT